MENYLILMNPGHNRAYFASARKLALSELALAANSLSTPCADIEETALAGIPYVSFAAEGPLSAEDIASLSRLSFVYALFRREGEALAPLALANYAYIDSKLCTIMKYTGKTNELFTRMLINCALFSADRADKTPKLFDPVAGKGTTLFDGLVTGMDVFGMEIGPRAAAEGYRCLKRFLEDEKLKHKAAQDRISGEGRSFSAERYTIDIFRTKDEERAGESRRFELAACSSEHANRVFKKNSFDIIAGDLPYGVQHASVTKEAQSKFTRSPAELLSVCLPAWKSVLRPGGAMALSWNTNVLSRPRMEDIIESAGLRLKKGGAYAGFSHRVDQAIVRDIIVALK